MLKICLVFRKSEPQYAYKRYAYKRKNMYMFGAKLSVLFVRAHFKIIKFIFELKLTMS